MALSSQCFISLGVFNCFVLFLALGGLGLECVLSLVGRAGGLLGKAGSLPPSAGKVFAGL